MASSSITPATSVHKGSEPQLRIIIWLDDNAGNDMAIKTALSDLFTHVRSFHKHEECLKFVESSGLLGTFSILVSGKYGELLVPTRFQPLPHVKNIYVFCFDVNKHRAWARTCNKVRLVESKIELIFKQMATDNQKLSGAGASESAVTEDPTVYHFENEKVNVNQSQSYIKGNGYYERLAMDLIVSQEHSDGIDDFRTFCQDQNEKHIDDLVKKIRSNQPLSDWFQPTLKCVQIRSTDFESIWSLRWFLRTLYQKMTTGCPRQSSGEGKITVYCEKLLNKQEINDMKENIGETIIFTEFITAEKDKNNILRTMETKPSVGTDSRVIFEIQIDKKIISTVPYAVINEDRFLLWFGSRHRITKIELLLDETLNQNCWLIGLNLCPSSEISESMKQLDEAYREEFSKMKNNYYALGRILVLKGAYTEAQRWFAKTNHYEDMAELAVLQYRLKEAEEYLSKVTSESERSDLLRAYLCMLSSADQLPTARSLLTKLHNETEDKYIRSKAAIGIGFHHMAVSQLDHALDYFKAAAGLIKKKLPENHPIYLNSLVALGFGWIANKDLNKAEECFTNALAKQIETQGINHPNVAKTHYGLALCYLNKKDGAKQAYFELESALSILLTTFSKTQKQHPQILEVKYVMTALQKGEKVGASKTVLNYI